MPFFGKEILVLGAAFYLTAGRGGAQEVIIINRETLQRAWASVVLERFWNSWYPSRLLARSHGRQLEAGKFLNEQVRHGPAMELRKALKE